MDSAPAAPPSSRWLFGPLPDLLLGCGLAYGAVFAMLWAAGPRVEALLPASLFPLLLLVTGTPHYGATLLRVYERREDRHAYAIFAVWATVAMVVLFLLGTRSILVGSLLLTVMLTWSPWHYTGQNYGIALMFLRRRGVEVTPLVRRLVHASFLLSFLLTLLAVHGAVPGGEYAPSPYRSPTYRFIPLGIPEAVQTLGFAVLGAAYLAATLAAAFLLLRRSSLRDLGPAAALVGTQALWFAAPVLARAAGVFQQGTPLAAQSAAYAFLWVAVGHSVQYLWITTYYARRSRASGGNFGFWARSLFAGAALWTLPALLFAPGLAGRVPFDSGLELLIAAVVNLHHFVLDGAIWKLRDGRIARVLIRSDPGQGTAPALFAPRWRLAPWVWALGAGCVVLSAVGTLEHEFGVRRAAQRGDVERVARANQRLAWIGRESAESRALLGVLRADSGEVDAARREVERSLGLYPTALGWSALGRIHVREGHPETAVAAYQRALELDPALVEAANDLAWLRATHPSPQVRDSREAIELAERASLATGYADPRTLDTLAAAYASAWRFRRAEAVATRAHQLALDAGERQLATEIEGRRALYAKRRRYVPAGTPGR